MNPSILAFVMWLAVAADDTVAANKYRPEDWQFVDNGALRMGIKKTSGAGVGWLSSSGSSRNLLNHTDHGRLVQQSYYGRSDGSLWGDKPWRWNPVQGGDYHGNPATVLELRSGANWIYAKTRGKHWASGAELPDVTLEEWISLDGMVARIQFRLAYSGTESHPERDQEIPAFFVEPDLDTLVLYDGTAPWTGGATSRSRPGWPNEGRSLGEPWAAYVDAADFGVGALVPIAKRLTCYRFGDGKVEKGACSYLAPLASFAVTPGLTFEYEVFLTIGKSGEIRERFRQTMATRGWPEFRGPTCNGLSNAVDLPVSWSATENVRWKQGLPGQGWSSPVIADGRLYLTSGEPAGDGGASLRLIALDSSSGKIEWNVEVFRPDSASSKAMHSKNSLASSTPILRGDRIYVHFGHMGTAALTLKGEVAWRQSEIQYPPVHGNGGSPVLVGDTLVFSCDGRSDPFVAGLDAKTGAVRWKTPRNTPAKKSFSFSTPLAIEVGGARQVILPGAGLVAAYDPTDGSELWRVRYGEGYSVVPRPVLAHGLLFLSSGFDEPLLHAIRAEGARGDATDSRIAWTARKGAPLTCSALALGDELYFVSDGGVATCLDARTGKSHWTARLGGNFSSSPVAAEGRVYFQSEEGVGHVVRAGKTFELLSKNDLEERTLASYAVSDGAIFLRTEKHLWRIGR